MKKKVKLVKSSYDNTFEWHVGNQVVAYITLYPGGLIEFSGTHDVAIEFAGSKDEAIIVDGLTIQ